MTVMPHSHHGDQRPLRVAVIGSGLAGLTTAYLLRQQGVEVWVLEKIGFYSSSVDIPPSRPTANGANGHGQPNIEEESKESKGWTIDVPMRSFQGGYYPLLIALYRHLRIPLLPTFYTFSFSSISSCPPATTQKSLGETYFIYSGASGRSLPSLPSPYLQDAYSILPGILSFVSMALCFLVWSILAFLAYHDLLPRPLSRTTPLRVLGRRVGCRLERPFGDGALGVWVWTPLGAVWEDFVARVVVPIFSAVGTMTSQDVLGTPIGALLDYAHTTIGTPHYALAPGFTARSVAERLILPVEEQGEGYVRLGEGVEGLRKVDGGMIVETSAGELEVDRVVIATQPTAARALLEMLEVSLAKEGEKGELRRVTGMKRALEGVESRETIVVSHRDHSVLPPSPDRREINLHLPEAPSSSSGSAPGPSSTPHFPPSPSSIYTMATHVIAPPLHCKDQYETVLQTTNPVVPIDPCRVLSIARLERALPLKDSATTMTALHPPHHEDEAPASVYLAGSYAYPGIPLLEGCVGSAIRAVESITGSTGDVDWDAGQGSTMGRTWRWRRRRITAF